MERELMRLSKSLSYALLIIVLFAMPIFVKGEYYLHVLILCAINIILTSSLRAISTTGQLSLGHAGFMSIGAYTSAILVMKVGISTYAGLILGGVAAMALAAVIAYPITRVKTVYFSMLTIFLGEVISLLATEARDITGGTSGLINIRPLETISIPGLFTIDFSAKLPNYYFVLVLMLITLLFLYSVDRSYIGMTCKAIAQDDSLAASTGINVAKFKAVILCISCFFTGLAGSFYAHYISVITPDSFGLFVSINLLIYMIVGGTRRFSGPIIGALILTLLPELFRVLKEYQPFIFVAVLYLVVYLLPGGLVNLPAQIKLSLRNDFGRSY
jgi:branched-chain amino acid transport system permease protein